MAMVVNHNIPALQTYNTVNATNNALNKSIQKLSTGLRINSAADDAAGLAISEKMRSQINGMDRAVSNAQDGISMIQTAEGALSETHSILQRMRELSVQAANDTLTSQDRSYIQLEIDELRDEVTRIGNTTQFNKKKLLNGDAAVLWSSSDLSTKAVVKGGLRSIDQFGQKVVTEGNYNIKIRATAGQGEVQKTDLFKIKHENVVVNKTVNGDVGVKDVTVNNVPAGSYKVNTVKMDPAPATGDPAVTTGTYKVGKKISNTVTTADVGETELQEAGTVYFVLGTVDSSGATTGIKMGNGVKVYETAAADSSGNPAFTLTKGQTASDTQKDLMDALIEDVFGSSDSVTLSDGTVVKYRVTSETDSAGATTDSYTFTATRLDGSEVEGNLALAVAGEDSSGSFAIAQSSDITLATTTDADATVDSIEMEDIITSSVNQEALAGSASILFEVTNVDKVNGIVELKAIANILSTDGTNSTASQDNIVLSGTFDSSGTFQAGEAVKVDVAGEGALTLAFTGDSSGATGYNNIDALSKGSKFVYNITKASGNDQEAYIEVSGRQNGDWDDNWANMNRGVTDKPMTYTVDTSKVAGKDVVLKNYYLNEKTGESNLGEITLSTSADFADIKVGEENVLAKFDAAYVGQVAVGDAKLRDLDKFWTSEGVFMLTDPQTLTITQGDGKQASVTLYATDTLDDVASKLNEAIATGLGQAQYVDDGGHFATFVTSNMATATGSETVPGTFIIRSAVPGAAGSLSFSGSEDMINALSLNTLQSAKETTYTANVEDAHSGAVIASNVKVTGNKLVGVINPNVDVEFDSLAGVKATWDNTNKKFAYTSEDYTTTLHLSDNTTVFQIGANEGEDMGVHIGDMRANALGIDAVNVTNREAASRSITILDNAIDKVSTQRAKLGAYQNRLEHTINNLNIAAENITSAESRIRDTDMAKEMMNFTKLQIMLQAGTSMLAQANQLPQNVLSLVR